jgi:PAS domain S-box-containing protein
VNDVKNTETRFQWAPLGWKYRAIGVRMPWLKALPQRMRNEGHLIPLLVLLLCVVAGLLFKQVGQAESRRLLDHQFQQTADAMAADIREQGRQYENLLRSQSVMAGHLMGSENASTHRDYLQTLQWDAICPEHCKIGLTETDLADNAAFGPAMARAQEVNGPVVLRAASTALQALSLQERLLMFMPIGNRTASTTKTLAYMSFDAGALLRQIPKPQRDSIAVTLLDSTPASAEEQQADRPSAPEPAAGEDAPLYSTSRTITFGGKVWTVVFQSRPAFEAALNTDTPTRYLRNMVLLGLLLAIIARLELNTRQRAKGLADQLTQELQKLQRAVEQSPLSTIIADTRGRIEYVSSGYTKASGFTPRELIGQSIALAEVELGTPAMLNDLLDKIRTDGVWKSSVQNRRKNGSLCWESRTISGMTDAQGQLTHLLLVKENISDRIRGEKELRSSEAFSLAIMESIADAIVVVDRSGTIVRANGAWRAFTSESGACPHAAAVHAHIDYNFLALCENGVYFTASADATAVREGLSAVLNGRLAGFQYEYACKSKWHPLWFRLTVTPLGAGLPGAVISNSDITDRKRSEIESQQYQQRLEQKVSNSTAQLGTLADELMQAETRERRMLAEDLHDDLGQSLTVLKLKLSLLDVQVSQEGRDYLQRQVRDIESVVDQASESVRSISTHLSPPVLHQDGLVAALHWLAEEMLRTYGLGVTLDCHADLHLNETFGGAIYRTVRELLINIWKHAEVSTAQVAVHLDPYSHMTVIRVSDQGKGFDVLKMQAPSSTLSYGIYSIRERMNLIGGALQIDSNPGLGTTVTLMIPGMGLRPLLKDKAHDSTVVGG